MERFPAIGTGEGGHSTSGRPKTLLEVTNRQRSHLNAKNSSSDTFNESSGSQDYAGIQDRRQVQWSYRRRDNTDRSSQPHCAPTDIAAQQQENFQRFYRAVVSPTHVRVTAGGRIVPNTRTVAPPLFEWNSDKFFFEPTKLPADPPFRYHQPNIWQPNSFAVAHPSLVPGGFQPALNFLQLNQQVAPHGITIPTKTESVKESASPEQSHVSESKEEIKNENPQDPGSQPIKLSHPSNFDMSKPFTFKGQTVYPLLPGAQPPPNTVPVNTMGHTNQLPQQPVNGYYQPHFGQPSFAGFNAGPQPVQQLPHALPAAGLAPGNHFGHMAQVPPGYFPLGPIAPSDMFDAQLNVLRSNLKAIDDDIANKNPTGDTLVFMNMQRQSYVLSLQTFEALKQNQLAQEVLGKKLSMEFRPPGTKFAPGTMAHNLTHAVNGEVNGGEAIPTHGNGTSNTARAPDPVTKSRLTMAAAKAPPFKPRSHVSGANNGHNGVTSSQSATAPGETTTDHRVATFMSPLLPKSDPVSHTATFMSPGPHHPREPVTFPHGTSLMSPGAAKPASYSQTFMSPEPPKLGPYFQPTTFVSSVATSAVPSVPYLVGSCPPGVSPAQVRPDQLLYTRPLTEDETKARQLYWGKAPRSLTSGLPKFDGRNFYPPSPVKENARVAHISQPSTSSVGTSTSSTHSQTARALNFDSLFHERNFPEHKTSSPAHHLNSLLGGRPLLPVPQPVFEMASRVQESGRQAAGHTGSFYTVNGQPAYQNFAPPVGGLSVNEQEFGSELFAPFAPEYGSASPSDQLAHSTISGYGYASPSVQAAQSSNGDVASTKKTVPATPVHSRIRAMTDEEITLGSWGKSQVADVQPRTPESSKTESTVEFQLSPKIKSQLKPQTFAERVENFRRSVVHFS